MRLTLIVAAAFAAVMNVFCFLLMGYDKRCAQNGKRRIPERTLFLSAGLFGALGGTLAMYLFRHKTKHWYFKVFFPLMMIVQILIFGFAAWKGII